MTQGQPRVSQKEICVSLALSFLLCAMKQLVPKVFKPESAVIQIFTVSYVEQQCYRLFSQLDFSSI